LNPDSVSPNDGSPASSGLTRRDVLMRAGAGGMALTLGSSFLAACGGGGSTAGASTASGPIKRGGTLTAGLIGGSSSDTLYSLNAITTMDFCRCIQIYDQLTILNPDGSAGLWLAKEIVPNADATEWTVRLKDGITFHDGKPLTADDVIYTMQLILDPKKPTNATVPLQAIDRNKLQKVDNLTVKMGTHVPFATFAETAASISNFGILPVGWNEKHPIGTGPFKFVSLNPGTDSTFVRNPNYWQDGKPYVDKLVIKNFADETTQVNALLGGQVDAVDQLSSASISSIAANGQARSLISTSGGFNPFTMRVDVAPFNDNRVREAMRLICDRQEMLNVVFDGHGKVANDLWSPWDPMYDHSIPQRPHDPEKAKALLKQAGHEGLSVQLVTADVAQGVVNTAQVFAQQAKAAGVNVSLKKVTVTEFYGPNYLQWPFAQDYYFYLLYFPQVAEGMLKGAPYNETHYNNPAYTKLYNQALAETDFDKRKVIAQDMQQIDYNEGSYIIPYFPPVIDGLGPHVQGSHGSRTGQSLGNYDFASMWLD
jgi:peptide/nickel transport system substrate-binding protein